VETRDHTKNGAKPKSQTSRKLIKLKEMKNISTRHIIDILLLLILLVFIGQNLESVNVKFLLFGFELPLIILITIVFIIGFYTAKAFNKNK